MVKNIIIIYEINIIIATIENKTYLPQLNKLKN